MKRTAVVRALSLLIGGVALVPSTVHSAPWISATDSYAASWVAETREGIAEKGLLDDLCERPSDPSERSLAACQRATVRSNVFGTRTMASSLPTRPIYAPSFITWMNWER